MHSCQTLMPDADGSAGFFGALPILTDFRDITRRESFASLPQDWSIALCDVRDSTRAIESGNYKHVNTVAAAAVTAVLNAAGSVEIPFIFEGDGSAFCVPPLLLDAACAALLHTRHVAQVSFGLELRVASVPLADVRAAGFDALVARYRVSPNYVQAVFGGGAMAWAERAMKDPATAQTYAIDSGRIAPHGSLDGLECRWQDIPSRHGETVSVMVRALDPDPARAAATYRTVIDRIAVLYGEDDDCHPVSPDALSPALDAARLWNEVGVHHPDAGVLARWVALMRVRWFVVLGWFLMRFGLRTELTDWSGYKPMLSRNSDVRKFNDVFRQVLAGTAAQREALEAWLQERFAARELVYGIHGDRPCAHDVPGIRLPGTSPAFHRRCRRRILPRRQVVQVAPGSARPHAIPDLIGGPGWIRTVVRAGAAVTRP